MADASDVMEQESTILTSKQSTGVAVFFGLIVLGLLGFPAQTTLFSADGSADQNCDAFPTYLRGLQYSAGSSQQSFHQELEIAGTRIAVSGKYKATAKDNLVEVTYTGYTSNPKQSSLTNLSECSGRLEFSPR